MTSCLYIQWSELIFLLKFSYVTFSYPCITTRNAPNINQLLHDLLSSMYLNLFPSLHAYTFVHFVLVCAWMKQQFSWSSEIKKSIETKLILFTPKIPNSCQILSSPLLNAGWLQTLTIYYKAQHGLPFQVIFPNFFILLFFTKNPVLISYQYLEPIS